MVTTRAAKKKISRAKPSADRILDSAEKLFADQGYGETSLRQLMTASNVSTTAFYARFASKELVLEALIQRLLHKLYDAAHASILGAEGLDESFEEIAKILIEYAVPNKALIKLMLTEASTSVVVMPTIRAAIGAMAAMISRRFVGLLERGVVEDSDPNALSWALIGTLYVLLVRWAVYEELDDRGLVKAMHSISHNIFPALVRRREPK